MMMTMKQLFSQYLNSRLLTVLFLGFSSGLPLALTSSTLQAWFTVSGIDLVTIGALTLVAQPYVYKFLWAPLMDRFVPPLLGRRRGWMLLTQCSLIITIAAMAFLNPIHYEKLMSILAVVIAFLSASQDIAIDAYRTDVLHPEERGLGAAYAVAGYRMAMLISGGLALITAQWYGWQFTYLMMSGLMLIGVISSWFAPQTHNESPVPQTMYQAVVEPFREFLKRNNAMAFLLLIVLYKLGEAFTTTAGSLSTTFLLRGLGFSLATVGTVNKGVGVIATMFGVFLAGFLMTRIRLYRALFAFAVLQAFANLLFTLLAMVGKNYVLMATVIFFDNFCAGLGMAALVALIMSLCDPRYTATQFALLSALAAMPRVFSGPIAGIAVEYLGWTHFFFWTFILALPCLLVLKLLQDDINPGLIVKRVYVE